MAGTQDIAVEMHKVDLWLETARKQLAGYVEPAAREAADFKRYDYYLQASASEASFALEHLVRAIHFIYRKHPEPSFQMTEALIADANRYLEKAGQMPVKIDGISVLRAAIANDEDLNADVKVDRQELEIYIRSIEAAAIQAKVVIAAGKQL